MGRLIDCLVAAIAIAILSPLLFALGLAVKVSSPGPILYRAKRVGKNGRLFDLLKFRSMFVGALHGEPRITRHADPRVTPLGNFLRRWKLDELPQLINVLTGEMSLVGPRPEDPQHVALYTKEQRRALSVAPGLTSPASLAYLDESRLLDRPDWETYYTDVVMCDKLRLDIEYLQRRTLLSDCRIVLQTLQAIVTSARERSSDTSTTGGS